MREFRYGIECACFNLQRIKSFEGAEGHLVGTPDAHFLKYIKIFNFRCKRLANFGMLRNYN